MIHFVLHDRQDSVAVVVVEGVKAGMKLKGWIMDEDKMTSVTAKQDIPIGHKVALRNGVMTTIAADNRFKFHKAAH